MVQTLPDSALAAPLPQKDLRPCSLEIKLFFHALDQPLFEFLGWVPGNDTLLAVQVHLQVIRAFLEGRALLRQPAHELALFQVTPIERG